MTLIAYVFKKLKTAKCVVRELSEKSRFRRTFVKLYGKRSRTLMKFEGQHLYQIHWSLWKQLSCKKYLLVICRILGLFVNSLAANDKYSLLSRDNLTQPIDIQLSKKQKMFLEFFLHF